MIRALTVIFVAMISMAGCVADGSGDPSGDDAPNPDPDPDPDPDPSSTCLPDAVLGRVWEFSSNGSFFYLQLNDDGTYRRETDVQSSSVLCEHGGCAVSGCGMLAFQTCHGTVELRAWTASGPAFTLDQTTYHESSQSADTAFIFCEPDACN